MQAQDNERVETIKILDVQPDDYPGGIAAWGALNPVYDTTQIVSKPGVHIHARKIVGGSKSIDETYDIVRVKTQGINGDLEEFTINGEDAASYNITAIFKLSMTYLRCPDCGTIHSDHDYNAVHPHLVHTCECGRTFESQDKCISNPVIYLKELFDDTLQDREVVDPVDRTIVNYQKRKQGENILLARYQIWGSNPAVLWTSPKPEEGGIHVHMFVYAPLSPTDEPTADETYGRVNIDGINLDPEQIRCLMAQQSLEYLSPFIQSLNCPACSKEHFDRSEKAIDPHSSHTCEHCGAKFPSPETNPLAVSNPAFAAVHRLRQNWDLLVDEQEFCYTE